MDDWMMSFLAQHLLCFEEFPPPLMVHLEMVLSFTQFAMHGCIMHQILTQPCQCLMFAWSSEHIYSN